MYKHTLKSGRTRHLEIFAVYYLDNDEDKDTYEGSIKYVVLGNNYVSRSLFLKGEETAQELYPEILETVSALAASSYNCYSKEDYSDKLDVLEKEYKLTKKKASEVIKSGLIVPALRRVWVLPTGHNLQHLSITPHEEGEPLAYVENWGILPVRLLKQPQLERVLIWEEDLTPKALVPTKFYLKPLGWVKAIVKVLELSVVYYYDREDKCKDKCTKFYISDETDFTETSIGCYESLKSAYSHHKAYIQGIQDANEHWQSQIQRLTPETLE